MENMVKANYKFWKNKRVLITGHSGFKGTWLSLWLNQLEAEICGISLEPDSKPNLYDQVNLSNVIEKDIMADITIFDQLKRVIDQFEPEIVFHLAAQPLVLESYKEPLVTWKTNVMGTVNLLNCFYGAKKKCVIIVITTDKVYENNEWLYGYRENDRLGGHDPYSSSKAAVELLVDSWRNSFCDKLNSNIKLATVRAGNVIGGGDWAEYRLIPDIIRAAMQNKSIKLRNPFSTRPWQHVLEPLNGYMKLAEKLYLAKQGEDNLLSSAFNFGPEYKSNRTVEEVAENISRKWNNGLIIEKVDNINHEADLLKLDISKAKSIIGWKPLLSFEETIEMTVNWYKEVLINNKDGYRACLDDVIFFTERVNL